MRLYEFRRNYKTPAQIEIQDLLKRVSTVRIRPGAPEICRARYHHGAGLFWSKGRIRTVDTRVTDFPEGGVFESARGHQKIMTASRERRRFWFVGTAGRIRAVDTRVSNFPAGGRIRPEHQRFVEPGTATVPGSSGLRHAVVFAASDKESARLLGEQAGACERICLRRKP